MMNNDLISREALKKAFESWKTMDDYYHDTDCKDIPLSEAFDLIDNAPTVEITEEQAIDKLHETGWLPRHDKEMTERPTGHWEKADTNMYHCSHCGCVDSIGFANFCWLCGADMRGSVTTQSNGKEKKTLTEAFMEDINTDDVDYNELCYRTGHHLTMCDCELCDHKHECSGYEGDDDDE